MSFSKSKRRNILAPIVATLLACMTANAMAAVIKESLKHYIFSAISVIGFRTKI
jgi:branched-subunit amino acid transport protein